MFNGFRMKRKCLSKFYFKNLFLFLLSVEAYGLPYVPDSSEMNAQQDHSTVSGGSNHHTVKCHLLFNNENQRNQQGRQLNAEVLEALNEKPVLDFNQTLSTVDLHPANTVCYDDLGCITRFSFADPLLWPINLLPESRPKIDTHFTLHTRENPNPEPPSQISAGDPNAITATTFKATRPTKFFIHGWVQTGYEDLYQYLVQNLLEKGDFNVVVVHWGGGSCVNYYQAHANTRLVGLEIALLVNTMVEKLGVQMTDVHLIGHSLGAHTAGYAGEKIQNLNQITGLDPAGPYFRRLPSYARLDYTDAKFVDGFHTNGDIIGLGIYEPAGHIDFYANGGKQQPGCEPLDWSQLNDPAAALTDVIACAHMRAVRFYSASLHETCQIIGYECSDYGSFNNGQCTSCGSDNTKCAPFGLQAINYPSRTRVNVELYFHTAENTPYCISQYMVLIKLGKPPSAKATVTGLLHLSVTGEDGRRTSTLPISTFEHGNDHRFLLGATSSLGPIRKVFLRWKYIQTDLLDPTCFLGMCNKRLYVNSVTVSSLNSYPEANIIANTYVTCPRYTPAAIPTFKRMEFSIENSCSSTFHLLNFIWNVEPSIWYYR